MPASLPAFVEDVPDYAVRGGRMFITMGGGFCVVMPVHVFLDGCEAGKAAVVDWQKRQCDIDRNVVFLPRR